MGNSSGCVATGQLFFLFVLFNGDRLEIFGVEDLTAIQAFHIIYAVTPCDDFGAIVFTSGLHKTIWDLF